jgi:hypothetical protein
VREVGLEDAGRIHRWGAVALNIPEFPVVVTSRRRPGNNETSSQKSMSKISRTGEEGD